MMAREAKSDNVHAGAVHRAANRAEADIRSAADRYTALTGAATTKYSRLNGRSDLEATGRKKGTEEPEKKTSRHDECNIARCRKPQHHLTTIATPLVPMIQHLPRLQVVRLVVTRKLVHHRPMNVLEELHVVPVVAR